MDQQKPSQFQRLVGLSTNLVERYLPDAFAIVLALTTIVFLCGLAFESQSPLAMIEYWGDGFWDLLGFSMQMMLVLVTGFILASSPPIDRLLTILSQRARTPGQAIVLVTVVALAASWLNWGFGLIIGSLLAKKLAQQIERLNYGLLVASGYSAFVVWHGGLSGSVPLTIATPGHFSENLTGIIPVEATIFAPFNIVITISIVLLLPLINWAMNRVEGHKHHLRPGEFQQEPRPSHDSSTLSSAEAVSPTLKLLERSWLFCALIGLMGFIYLGRYFINEGLALNLNIVNFSFLILGLVLHRSPEHFLESLSEAIKGAGPILIQFPFYAGIMGMMVHSGLAGEVSQFFIDISNRQTLPLFTFISAGLLNVFVPSGGGQWAIQSELVMPAAAALGAEAPRVAMAVAWGDAWTNLIQPFWALPTLAIAGLRAKDIMGYCLISLVGTGAIIALGLTLA